MRVGIFYRIAQGNAPDSPGSITITGNNVSAAQLFAFRSDLGGWDFAGVGGVDTTTGTPHSVTMPSNPGITAGDMLLAVGVIPTDITTPAQFKDETVSATGMTTVSLTEINEWDTSLSNDLGGWVAQGAVVSGTATGNPTVSATAGGTTLNVAGPIYLVRMREALPQISASDSASISVNDEAFYGADALGNKTQKFTGAPNDIVTPGNTGNTDSPPLYSYNGLPYFANAGPSPAGGTYCQFGGSASDGIYMKTPSYSNQVSFSSWIYIQAANFSEEVFQFTTDPGGFKSLRIVIDGINSSSPVLTMSNWNNSIQASTPVLQSGVWCRVAVQAQTGVSGMTAFQVYDSSDTKIYDSGILSGDLGTLPIKYVGAQKNTTGTRVSKMDQWVLRSDFYPSVGANITQISASDSASISLTESSATQSPMYKNTFDSGVNGSNNFGSSANDGEYVSVVGSATYSNTSPVGALRGNMSVKFTTGGTVFMSLPDAAAKQARDISMSMYFYIPAISATSAKLRMIPNQYSGGDFTIEIDAVQKKVSMLDYTGAQVGGIIYINTDTIYRLVATSQRVNASVGQTTMSIYDDSDNLVQSEQVLVSWQSTHNDNSFQAYWQTNQAVGTPGPWIDEITFANGLSGIPPVQSSIVYKSASDTASISAVEFRQTSFPPFENLLLNSNYGFETGDTSGWTQSGTATATLQVITGTYAEPAWSGRKMLKVTITGAGTFTLQSPTVPFNPLTNPAGTSYLRHSVRLLSNTSKTYTFQPMYYNFDKTSNYLSSPTALGVTAGSWASLGATWANPNNFKPFDLQHAAIVINSGSATVGDIFYVDAAYIAASGVNTNGKDPLDQNDYIALSASESSNLFKTLVATDSSAISVLEILTDPKLMPYLHLDENFEGGTSSFDSTISAGSSTVVVNSSAGYNSTYGARFHLSGLSSYAYLRKSIPSSTIVYAEAWFRFNSASSDADMLTLYSSNNKIITMFRSLAGSLVLADPDYEEVVPGATIALGEWNRIGLVEVDDGSRIIWFNGQRLDTGNVYFNGNITDVYFGKPQSYYTDSSSVDYDIDAVTILSDTAYTYTPQASADTTAVSAADVSNVQVSVSTTDTSAISVADSSAVILTAPVSTTDTAAVSVAEARQLVVTQPTTDTAAISIADVSNSAISLSRTDISGVSISDARAQTIIVSTTDSAGISIVESSSAFKQITVSDTIQVSVDEHRQINYPPLTNLLVNNNYNFETGTSPWTSNNATLSVVDGAGTNPQGQYYLKAVCTGDGNVDIISDIVPANYLLSLATMGVSIKTTTGETVSLGIQKYDDTKALKSISLGVNKSVGTSWSRINDSFMVSELDSDVQYYALLIRVDSAVAGQEIYIDSAYLQSGTENLYQVDSVENISVSISDSSVLTNSANLSASDTAALSISENTNAGVTQPGSDSVSIGIVEQVTILTTRPSADASAISVAGTSAIAVSVATTDTSAVSVAEARTNAARTTTTDTAAVSIVETRTLAVAQSTTDTSAISIGETSSNAVAQPTTDTAAISIGETTQTAVSQPTVDTAAISIAETTSGYNTFATTDTSSVSIAEVSGIGSSTPGSDNAAVSVTEQVTILVTTSTTDTSAISIGDVSVTAVTTSATDTFAISIGDVSQSDLSLSRTDTAAISIAETTAQYLTVPTTDTGSIAVSENTSAGVTQPGSDGASISIVEQTTVATTQPTTDSASISIVEISSVFVTITTSDTGAISIGETSAIASSTTTTDTSAISIAETTASAISVNTTDTSAVSITETNARFNTMTATDTGAVTITENSNIGSALPASDGASIGVVEQSALFVSVSTTDTGSLAVAEAVQTDLAFASTDTGAVSVAENTASALTTNTSDTSSIAVSELSSSALSTATTDTGSIAIDETNSSYRTFLTTDSGSVSVNETTSSALTVTTTDSTAITITENAGIGTDAGILGSDSSALGIVEQSSLFITKQTDDTGSVAVSENVNTTVVVSGSESTALTIADSASTVTSSSASDTSSVAVNEVVATNVDVSVADVNAISVAETTSTFVSVSTNDTASLEVSETTALFADKSTSDTASIAISENSSVDKMLPGSDTASIGITEQTNIFITSSATDSSSLSVADTSAPFVAISGSDTAALSASDQATSQISISSSDAIVVSVNEFSNLYTDSSDVSDDFGSIGISEQANIFVTLSASDSAALSISEQSAPDKQSAASDQGAIGISEQSSVLVSFASSDEASISVQADTSRSNTMPGTDNISIATTEQVSIIVSQTRNDGGSIAVSETSGFGITPIIASDGGSLAISENTQTQAQLTANDSGQLMIAASTDFTIKVEVTDSAGIVLTEDTAKFARISAADSAGIHVVETQKMMIAKSSTDALVLHVDAVVDSSQVAQVHVYYRGAWHKGTPMVYKNKKWRPAPIYIYTNGMWVTQ
jgi:hypothetical protein